MVAGEARRSCLAGGSFAYLVQGEASGHAMCSGCDLEMAEVCPGVSISCIKYYLSTDSFLKHPSLPQKTTYHENIDSSLYIIIP